MNALTLWRRFGLLGGGLAMLASAPAQADLTLHDFGGTVIQSNGKSGPDGIGPLAGLTFDASGNMYGTAASGANGAGLVWEITSTGQYKDLHDFGGTTKLTDGATGPDGANPNSGVTVDAAGNLYGVTANGGPNRASGAAGDGVLWKISKAGVYQVLHEFGGSVNLASGAPGPDGVNPACTLTFDPLGNLYGTTPAGGGETDRGGILWELSAKGAYLDLHDFGGSADGSACESSVTIDKTGNLYGTASAGGSYGDGIVWRLASNGQYTVLHTFGLQITNADGKRGPDGVKPFGGVLIDATGNLYGTTSAGGPNATVVFGIHGDGILWEITASGSYVDLHDFGGEIANANGEKAPDAMMPKGDLQLDAGGNLIGVGPSSFPNQGLVWELTPSHAYLDLHDFGGSTKNSSGQSVNDGSTPQGAVAFDAQGNVYGASLYGGANDAGVVWEIKRAELSSVNLSPSSLIGGQTATGTVTLTNPAPSAGLTISLASSAISATVPSTQLVPGGKTSATFSVRTVAVGTTGSAAIKATANGISKSASLTIQPPSIASLKLNPVELRGGGAVTGAVTLSGPAPIGGLVIGLSSSSNDVPVPASVTIAAGQTSATFSVRTTTVKLQTVATVKATLGGHYTTANLTLVP